MAKSSIFTVGFELPSADFEYVDFDSNQTLLDADICLFEPTMGSVHYSYEGFQGHALLEKSSSVDFKKNCAHWRGEIISAANAGKLVVVFMVTPIECYYYTGERRTSGTTRSPRATDIVNPCSSYDAIPSLVRVTAKKGTAIKLATDTNFFKPYWLEVSEYSAYEAEFEGKNTTPVLTAGASDRTVGAVLKTSAGGAILFIPPVDISRFIKEKDDVSVWTADGLKFARRLSATLTAMAKTLASKSQRTPPPSWSIAPEYRLHAEDTLLGEIDEIAAKITALTEQKSNCAAQLAEAGTLRFLLYEQGDALEKAVLEAMRLFGFSAENFSDGKSEFDVIFASAEGRCLGEVEGKENKAINIDKFSQLERNIQEDFARDDVSQYAKGVLFGNAFRLSPLEERKDFFTEKCLSAAQRVGAALIRTPDLFLPAKYLQFTPSDLTYAKKCREAIFGTSGQIVILPTPPS